MIFFLPLCFKFTELHKNVTWNRALEGCSAQPCPESALQTARGLVQRFWKCPRGGKWNWIISPEVFERSGKPWEKFLSKAALGLAVLGCTGVVGEGKQPKIQCPTHHYLSRNGAGSAQTQTQLFRKYKDQLHQLPMRETPLLHPALGGTGTSTERDF